MTPKEYITALNKRYQSGLARENSYRGDLQTVLGRIWINDAQHFNKVPKTAWKFYIGGYQPAQKWLKDRKGRSLNMEDVQHYQKIIVALMETGRLMGEVDGVMSLNLQNIKQ